MIEKMLDGLEELKFSYFLTIANTGCETMNHIMDHIYQEVAGAIDKCGEIIKDVAHEYNDDWIPCSERLPEEYGNYLITMDVGILEIAEYNPNLNKWYDLIFGSPVDVIAWMPLPEPYKGVE